MTSTEVIQSAPNLYFAAFALGIFTRIVLKLLGRIFRVSY